MGGWKGVCGGCGKVCGGLWKGVWGVVGCVGFLGRLDA